MVEWDRFGPAFCRKLPEEVPLASIQHIDEAIVLVSSVEKLNLTPDLHWILDKARLLTLEKNRPRKRQRMRDPADKASFNRAVGKLCRDLQAFRQSCWEFAVACMADDSTEEGSVHRIPSALTGKRRCPPLQMCIRDRLHSD